MYRHFGRGWLRAVTSFHLVALWVRPEGESVTDNILSVTLILYIIRVHRLIHIPRDIILPVYMYLLYLLDGTVEAWMKSSVFIHLTQLPSNPIIFGFGRLALRCDFSKTKIQPLTLFLTPISIPPIDIQQYYQQQSLYLHTTTLNIYSSPLPKNFIYLNTNLQIEIDDHTDFKVRRKPTT